MDSKKLYERLNCDFKINEIGAEPWDLDEIKKYVTPDFLKRNEGIMLDNTSQINKVYSVTFPDENLLRGILDTGEENILVFSHHAQSWQFGKPSVGMVNIPVNILDEMTKKKVSLYSIHIPLDNASEYSTSVTFAKKLGIQIEKNGFEYLDALTGVLGKTKHSRVSDLAHYIETVIGHATKVYNYGSEDIVDNKVAVVSGCANEKDVIEEVKNSNINTLVTGFSTDFKNNAEHDFSEDGIEAHGFARDNKINIIGTTHYSSEKFACIAMVNYFEALGISCEFVEGQANLEDL